MSLSALAALVLSQATPLVGACQSQPDADRIEVFEYQGETNFFPAGAVDAFECDWFSRHLTSLEERPLTSEDAVFRLRFLELPAFDYPMSITVSGLADGSAVIEARATNGAGGYEAGRLVYQEESRLSVREVLALRGEIERARLCRRHPDDEGVKQSDGSILVIADGTRNVFEWASGDAYCLRHAVAREDSELTKLAIWLARQVFRFDSPPPSGRL